VCRFAESDEVVNFACPPEVDAVPIMVLKSKKVIDSPSGTKFPWLIGVAVKVTGCPTKEGDPDVVTSILEDHCTFSV